MMATSIRSVGVCRMLGVVVLALVVARGARAEVAATGTFGIDISVPVPFTSGTFDGMIKSFDAGPFTVGGTPVDLQTAIGTMSIVNGVLPSINASALAATFEFDATDNGATANSLDFHGAGFAKCDNAVACAQGFGTFVADVTSQSDPNGILPDGYAYTFDGTVGVDGTGTYDAAGTFGLNAFLPTDVAVGSAQQVASGPTSYYDSRRNTLRDFLVELTFSEVTDPGTVTFLGKTAIPGSLPTGIALEPDLSIFIDIVTGNGLAFAPPVDVCIAYDDGDGDGVVDGTDVQVNTLRILHALALGENFQDVTTFAGGGRLCGQVDQLSPFVLAVGPAPTTTTTTTIPSTTVTTVTTTTTTTTSTLPGGLVPGGPTSKSSSDCYLELVVAGIENAPPQVEDAKKIFCTDGDPCDLGPCGDDVCEMRAGACVNQVDPNLPDCTPPAKLEKATIKNKLSISVPDALTGARCTPLVGFEIEAKFNGKGVYQAKKSKQSLKGKAKAEKGTSPRSDADKWTIYCQPRADACPGSASGAFVDDARHPGGSSTSR